MQFEESRNKGVCVICGKEVPVRDNRADRFTYCGRKCAALARFKTRYKGSLAGPMDKPKNIMDKAQEL